MNMYDKACQAMHWLHIMHVCMWHAPPARKRFLCAPCQTDTFFQQNE